MSITTYSGLQTAIAEWLARSDLTARVPTFIQLAERSLERVVETAYVVTGDLVLSTGEVALPSDAQHVAHLSVTANGVGYALSNVGWEGVLDLRGDRTGMPQWFAVVDRSVWLAPVPDMSYPATVVYRPTLDLAASTTGTNWLLDRAPDAYLYGSLLAAVPYLGDDGRVALWEAQYARVLRELQRDKDLSVGGGPLVQRTRMGGL